MSASEECCFHWEHHNTGFRWEHHNTGYHWEHHNTVTKHFWELHCHKHLWELLQSCALFVNTWKRRPKLKFHGINIAYSQVGPQVRRKIVLIHSLKHLTKVLKAHDMKVTNLVLPTCLPVIIFPIILNLFDSRMLSRLVACEILVGECVYLAFAVYRSIVKFLTINLYFWIYSRGYTHVLVDESVRIFITRITFILK
jgi:hypothetical protein